MHSNNTIPFMFVAAFVILAFAALQKCNDELHESMDEYQQHLVEQHYRVEKMEFEHLERDRKWKEAVDRFK